MSEAPNHAWTDLAASFALDVLNGEERAAFEAHLATCIACRTDVHAYREIVGELGHAATPRTPPGSLRARVLEEARAARPLPAASDRGDRERPLGSTVYAKPSHRGGRSTTGPWLAAAAGLIVAVAAAAAYAAQRGRIDDLEQRLAGAQAGAVEAGTEITRLESTLAQQDSLLAAALDPAARTTTLVAEGQPPSLRLFWNRERGRVIIAASDLAAPPAGRTYQLWGIVPGSDPISLGTFDTDAAGSAIVSLPLDPALEFAVAAVTEEPAGGSPQPTTQPFLVGDVAQ